jgi:multidrug resistance protein
VARPPRSDAPRAPLPAGFSTLWSTVAIDLIGFGIVLPILPQYAERFGATPVTVGLLVASFSLAQLVFAPIWGRLSDRIGRKPVLVVSLFGTAVGSLLTGLAGSLWLLFLGRIIDGASGASVSVAQASAADLASPADRPRLMGLLGAAFGLGFVVGPAIGALGALAGVHVPFFIAAGLAFVNAVVAIGRLPETAPARTRARTTTPTATGDPSAVAALARVDPDEAGLDAERIAAAPALDGPGLVEPAHLGEPVADGAQVSAIRRLIAVAFVAMVAFAGFEATFALLGDRRFGFDLAATGAVFAVIGLALVGVQAGLVGPVTAALGERAVLRLGLVANACGLALLALDVGWPALVSALALLVVGQGLLTPTLSAAVAGRAGDERGRWLGWQQSAGGLARVLGPVSAGVLFEQVGVGSPYLVGAVLVLVALALVP